MSTEEKELFKDEIRGINGEVIKHFVIGTIAVCSCVIGSVVWLKTTLVLHDYKIEGVEKVNDKQDISIQRNSDDILLLKK